MVKARTYAETLLLDETERALRSNDVHVLAILDRIREAAGLPVDPRVSRRLHQQLCDALLEAAR